MILQANNIHRKAGIAILTCDKIDFKITKVTKDKKTQETKVDILS